MFIFIIAKKFKKRMILIKNRAKYKFQNLILKTFPLLTIYANNSEFTHFFSNFCLGFLKFIMIYFICVYRRICSRVSNDISGVDSVSIINDQMIALWVQHWIIFLSWSEVVIVFSVWFHVDVVLLFYFFGWHNESVVVWYLHWVALKDKTE